MKRKQFNNLPNHKFIVSKVFKRVSLVRILPVLILLILTANSVFAQRVALVSPNRNVQTGDLSEKIFTMLSKRVLLVDMSLAKTLFDAEKFDRPYNLSTDESKNFGTRIGCNFFLLVNSDTLRRTSFEKDKYFESYAAFYLVSARTGKLVFWQLSKFEEDSAKLSREKLFRSLKMTANALLEKIDQTVEREIAEEYVADISETDQSVGLRPPMPYRRIKPQYTKIAALYDILATVDIAVDIDPKGNITKTEILRWAGFGLDEAVVETVKKMNWRPADRAGKPLPMRVLLRYNFKNIETEK